MKYSVRRGVGGFAARRC